MSNVYDVVIDGSGFSALSSPQDGFIDPTTIYQYMTQNGDAPTNLAAATAKARANKRFRNIILQVHFMCNAYVLALTPTGGDVDTPPSALTIRFEIEHGDGSLTTADESNAGQRLTGIAALKRCVARAMVMDQVRDTEIYDPTATTIVQNGADVTIPRGIVSNITDIGPVAANLTAAAAAITVTKIS